MKKICMIFFVLSMVGNNALFCMWRTKKKGNETKQQESAVSYQQEPVLTSLYVAAIGQALGLEQHEFFALEIPHLQCSVEEYLWIKNGIADQKRIPIQKHHEQLNNDFFNVFFMHDAYLSMAVANLKKSPTLHGFNFTAIRTNLTEKIKEKRDAQWAKITPTGVTLMQSIFLTSCAGIGMYNGITSLVSEEGNTLVGVAATTGSLGLLAIAYDDVKYLFSEGLATIKKAYFYEQLFKDITAADYDNNGDTYTITNYEE